MTNTTPSNIFQIGKVGGICYEGLMSEYRIYYKSLSPSQISVLYNKKPQWQYPPRVWDTIDLGENERVSSLNGVRCYGAILNINMATYGNGTQHIKALMLLKVQVRYF